MLNKDQLFEGIKKLNVLVIGDLMIDAYTWGKVTRISPEAPVPVVNVAKTESRLGGAGNVVMNLVSLGANPFVVSAVGDDARGIELKNLLTQQGVDVSGIVEDASRPTTVKERVLAGSQQLLRIDAETDQLVSPDISLQLLENVKHLIPKMHVVIFEDYDKGVLSESLIQEVIALAKMHHVPTVVDPKKRNFFSYAGVDLFKPNLSELKAGLNLSPEDLTDAVLPKTVKDFKENQSMKGVFVTLSERGVYIDYAGQTAKIPAHVRQIADVSGAGDTVISIAACALALGLPAKQIAELANLGGGLVCESLGVVPIQVEKLASELAHF
jgi:rfaE bifunctional protein kinase chain/domain